MSSMSSSSSSSSITGSRSPNITSELSWTSPTSTNPQSPKPQCTLAIRFEELVALQSLGINPSSIGFNNLTLESDKFICIREHSSPDSPNPSNSSLKDEVVIVDLSSPSSPTRRPITADSSIMHPDRRVMAIRSGHQLQVFDLDLKKKIASHSMKEDICFWKWINTSTISIVTQRSCYHWDVFSVDDAQPQHKFDRHQSLSDCQIINYKHYGNDWMLLVGIRAKEGRVAGAMQLYNIERRASQIVEGHTGDFVEIPTDPLALSSSNGGGATAEENSLQNKHSLFIFANRPANSSYCKVQISEINCKEGQPKFGKRSIEIPFPPEASSDFPIGLQVTAELGIMYVMTKFGFLYIHDLYTGASLYGSRISAETIFLSAPLRDGGDKLSSTGIIGVNRKGQVLGVSVDLEDPFSCFPSQQIACRLKILLFRAGIITMDSSIPFKEYLSSLLESGNLGGAIALYLNAPPIACFKEDPSIKERIAQMPSLGGVDPLLQLYIEMLRISSSLTETESMEFIHLFLSAPSASIYVEDLRIAIEDGSKLAITLDFIDCLIECSLKFGDSTFYTLSLTLLLPMASSGGNAAVHQRVCKAFAGLGQWGKLGVYLCRVAVGFTPDYTEIIGSLIAAGSVDQAVEGSKAILKGNPLSALGIFKIFMSHDLPKQGTAAVLDCCREDVLGQQQQQQQQQQQDQISTLCKAETMLELQELQTEILTVLLEMSPPLAIALLKPPATSESQQPIFTSYDHVVLSQIIENAFNISSPPDPILLCLAMEHSKTPNDLIRLLSKSSDVLIISGMDLVQILTILQWPPSTILVFFSLLFDLNPPLYYNYIVEVSMNLACLGAEDVIEVIRLFKDFPEYSFTLTKHYIKSPIFSSNPTNDTLEEMRFSLNTTHIKTCISLKKWDDLEDSIRRQSPFDGEEVFSSLLEAKEDLPSMIPLILLADLKISYLPPVIELLLQKDLFSWVTKYVERMNPSRLQKCVEILLDLLDSNNGDDNNINLSLKDIEGLLLNNYRHISDISSFYSILMQRNLTSLLIPLLKKTKSAPEVLLKCLLQEGDDVEVEDFLLKEKYSFTEVAKQILTEYASEKYVRWAIMAFKREGGAGASSNIVGMYSTIKDEDLSLYYSLLIGHLMKERSVAQWAKALKNIPLDGEQGGLVSSILDYINPTTTITTTCTSEDISPLLKALMSSRENGKHLLSVLEEMIYQEKFSNNPSLQNLFLKTMIRERRPFLQHLIKLEAFDAESILLEIASAKKAFGEEAHYLYDSFTTQRPSSKSKALKVLVEEEWGICNTKRAFEYCRSINLPSTWRCLAFILFKLDNNNNNNGDDQDGDDGDLPPFTDVLEAAKNGLKIDKKDDTNLNPFTSQILLEMLKKSPSSSKEKVLSFLLSFKEKENQTPHSPRFPFALDSEIIIHSILLGRILEVLPLIKDLSFKSPPSLSALLHNLIEREEFVSLKDILLYLKDYRRLTMVSLLHGDLGGSFEAWQMVPAKEKDSTFFVILQEHLLHHHSDHNGQFPSNDVILAKKVFLEFLSVNEKAALSSIGDVWEKIGLAGEIKEILMQIENPSTLTKDRLATLLVEHYPDEAMDYIIEKNNLPSLKDLALLCGRVQMAQEISFLMKDYAAVLDLCTLEDLPAWNHPLVTCSLEEIRRIVGVNMKQHSQLSSSLCKGLVKSCISYDPTCLASVVSLLLEVQKEEYHSMILDLVRQSGLLFLLKDSLSATFSSKASLPINVALAEIALLEGRFTDLKSLVYNLSKSNSVSTADKASIRCLVTSLRNNPSIEVRRLYVPLTLVLDSSPKGLLEALKMSLQLESFDMALDILVRSEPSPLLSDEILRYFSGIPSKLLSENYCDDSDNDDDDDGCGGRPMLFLLVCFISVKKASLRASIVRECNWIRKWDDICEPVMCVL